MTPRVARPSAEELRTDAAILQMCADLNAVARASYTRVAASLRLAAAALESTEPEVVALVNTIFDKE